VTASLPDEPYARRVSEFSVRVLDRSLTAVFPNPIQPTLIADRLHGTFRAPVAAIIAAGVSAGDEERTSRVPEIWADRRPIRTDGPLRQPVEGVLVLRDLPKVFDRQATDDAGSQIASMKRHAATEGLGFVFHLLRVSRSGGAEL